MRVARFVGWSLLGDVVHVWFGVACQFNIEHIYSETSRGPPA